MPTRAFVTGATGFVGAAVAELLVQEGFQVRVLVRPTSDLANIAGLDVETVQGDLRNAESLQTAMRGCDALFHVAADYRLWARRPQDLYDSNVQGTRNLMSAAIEAGVQRVVYTSSVATLGLHPEGRASNEDTPAALHDMVGHYKRSKFLAEAAVQELVAERGLPAVIVNPSTPVGPGDIKPTPTGRMIRDAAFGRIPAFVDTGLNIVSVADVARGHLLAHQRGAIGRRYILGGTDLSLQSILDQVTAVAGRRAPRLRLPRLPLYPIAWAAQAWASTTNGAEPQITVDGLRMSKKKMFFSSDRARQELDYAHGSAEEALRDATEWFLRR